MTLLLYSFSFERKKNFKFFKIPPFSSCSILCGAMHISCFETGMVVKARMCTVSDFGEVAKAILMRKGVSGIFKLT